MKNFFFLVFLTIFSLSARQVSLTPESATGGAVFRKDPSGLVIDFPAFDRKLNNTHPTVNLRLPPDCSAYDGVDVDLRLSGGLSSSLYINFRDETGKQCYDGRPIADGVRTTLRFRFNPARKMDKSRMKYLRIYLGRPPLASQFTIYKITLFSILKEKKLRLRAAAEKMGLAGELEKVKTIPECEAFTAMLRKKQLSDLISRSNPGTAGASFGGAFVSSLSRPLPFYGALPERTEFKGRISLAMNETENLHLITVGKTPLERVAATVSGVPSSLAVSLHPAGAVKTVLTNAPGAHLGWHFDPILEYTTQVAPLKAEQLQLWVLRVNSAQAAPGIYKGKVNFAFDGKNFSLPFEVKVRNFALPLQKSLKTATSVYGSKLMGKNKGAFEKWLLKNFYINNFSIYSETGSYGDPRLPAVSEYTDALKRGMNFFPIIYLKLPRQAHHTKKGIAPAKSKELWEKMSPAEQEFYPEEWKKKYVEILSKRIPELKKAGLWKYAACYAFDEAVVSEWPAIADLIRELKKHFPDLKIVSTLGDYTYGLRSPLAGLLDAWIPPVNQYSFERAEKARSLGRKVWYYTTGLTVDGTPLSTIRSQLGERAIALKVDGWLIWTVSRWYNNSRPVTSDDPLTCWAPESYPGNNGGGSYFCMGQNNTFLSTLRAEAMRDGIEDHQYYTTMLELAKKRNASDPLRRQAEELFRRLKRSEGIAPGELLENRNAAAELIERMK